ncbi:MAG: hypothetical protein AVDCRST_MAG33-2635, partial [uncultured Thermomicrobiales bacterium]
MVRLDGVSARGTAREIADAILHSAAGHNRPDGM